MTTEELMKPRYKVIADYFYNPYKIGDIITVHYNDRSVHLATTRYRDEFGEMINQHNYLHPNELNNFPHLFRPLQWWEDRKIEDMPEYVKSIEQEYGYGVKIGHVIKVKEWALLSETMYVVQSRTREYHPSCFVPATKEEYEAYLQTHNQLNDGQ